MRNIKYYFNTQTLRFEKLIVPWYKKLLRVFMFFASSFVTAVIILIILFTSVKSPREILLKQKNDELQEKYSIINKEIQNLELQMNELMERDNNVYRTIFEADPIPDSARIKAMEKDKELNKVQNMSKNELVLNIQMQLNNLSKLAAFQQRSYDSINLMVKNKQNLLAAIPAIQPVNNKDLKHIASGFGYRIDPVYKVVKFHAGLDFAAPIGTPIYATADGVVTRADFNAGGYGNHIIIDHGYGYETLYGHMYKMKATVGEHVKRGEVIGYVGSTGKSTGPHCHYEVHKNGKIMNPIYFFYNDLTPEQYDRILKLANTANQSLD
ncbi:MAG: M23 family metallopeptidase [Chitinophagaceae bacterium]|jgi:murein DD-endopeptidase MepM/ murein hydrolase activator NlpD|nr:M23 family metallopeptidase [Chitinophagaceae bacterium]